MRKIYKHGGRLLLSLESAAEASEAARGLMEKHALLSFRTSDEGGRFVLIVEAADEAMERDAREMMAKIEGAGVPVEEIGYVGSMRENDSWRESEDLMEARCRDALARAAGRERSDKGKPALTEEYLQGASRRLVRVAAAPGHCAGDVERLAGRHGIAWAKARDGVWVIGCRDAVVLWEASGGPGKAWAVPREGAGGEWEGPSPWAAAPVPDEWPDPPEEGEAHGAG